MFELAFATLNFSKSEHGIARYVLRALEALVAVTGEVTVAGPDHVHIEHIYPQSPKDGERWEDHDQYVTRLGNLTLLGRRLNEQIKNSNFELKKLHAYQSTRLAITEALIQFESWSPQTVVDRQNTLCQLAQEVWPVTLV